MSNAPSFSSRLIEKIALRPDNGRALRTAFAFGIPLVVCHLLRRQVDGVFIALSAQVIALQDIRGAYGVRLAILATMIMTAGSSVIIGIISGGNVITAVVAMGFIALLGGFWRHLSSDYGPPLSVSSALLFLLGLAKPGNLSFGTHMAGLVLLGGAGATILHVGFWLFRPQHPLRHAVAETWVATSELIAKMRWQPELSKRVTGESIAEGERALRQSLDRTFLILGSAGSRPSNLMAHLEEMRREVVHFSMRVIAFNSSLESILDQPDSARVLPIIDSVLKTLSDAARSVAITIITHRAENFAATEIRFQRCRHLIQVLDAMLESPAAHPVYIPVRAALQQIGQLLPRISQKLNDTIDHGASRSGIPQTLPDLSRRSVRFMVAWINPPSIPDPVLMRHSARMAVLTMLAVALYKWFDIPRGYWIALTILVVLQPDYGSTRRRAAERIGGTIAGSVLASALLWFSMPWFVLEGLAVLTSFGFAFFVRRSYGRAVFFVTLLIVLITETTARVDLGFTVSRLLSTLLGGGMALAAALIFWPVWERNKFPALLAAAIRANRAFLESMSASIGVADAAADADPLMARRRAENANRFAAESLKRLTAEPVPDDPGAERSAALTTYNQRITRALTAAAVHASAEMPGADGRNIPSISGIAHQISAAMESMASVVEAEGNAAATEALATNIHEIEIVSAGLHFTVPMKPGVGISEAMLIWTQLAKCIAEIKAMALALNIPLRTS